MVWKYIPGLLSIEGDWSMYRGLRITLSFILMIFISTNLIAGESITGYWKTVDDRTGKARSIVKIWEQEGKYYGKILLLVGEKQNVVCSSCRGEKKNKKIVGMQFINNFVKRGRKYINGSLLDPESGRVYRGKIWREGNRLKLRGYVLIFYRTQTWDHIGKAEMKKIFEKEGVVFNL